MVRNLSVDKSDKPAKSDMKSQPTKESVFADDLNLQNLANFEFMFRSGKW
ncbi:hypothetical protein IAD21_00833 [Abditibacteriota bacterium]|nr:hypothetical protein IAD21_00833 [Abditibacteriota bacterium]